MDKKLNEAVAALRPQMVAALQRLVRRRSVEADPLPGKPFGEEVDACFAEALTLCHELGFETTDMDRYIGWCEIGTGDEMVAVLGHLDVVPEGEGWHHPPYAAEIEGGRLYGRGAIDDKGPVVASLFALKAIRDLGIPPQPPCPAAVRPERGDQRPGRAVLQGPRRGDPGAGLHPGRRVSAHQR